ncbi:MAG TPA: FlgD immunoglobulin-like domain containing protein [Chitinophagaceae bacterium]|nr:FlgD immunoglobulin-like domain containing protein [Chitinophagaceae bacterium]
MKQKLLFLLAVLVGFASAVQAGPRHPKICLTNAYGEQASLRFQANEDGTTFEVFGDYDYTIFGGTIWRVKGNFDKTTGLLKFKAINPAPDHCTMWADQVNFQYTWTSELFFKGSFRNDCANYGDLTATGVAGDCGFSFQLPQGEYGGTGSRTMNRTQITLPKGQDIKEILKQVELKVSPNPAVSTTNITFTLSSSEKIQAGIYNQYGTLVYTLANTTLSAGKHSYSWNLQTINGGRAPKGTYWIKVTTSEGVVSEKIMVTQ